MSSKKTYILLRCPECGFYGLAQPGQKTRLCVRCGKTITIDYLHVRRADSLNEAQKLLGELNAKKDSETSRRLDQADAVPLGGGGRLDSSRVSTKGLLRTFKEEVLAMYTNKEVELTEFLGECERHGVSREYAQKLVEELVDSGQAYRPGKDRIRFLW